MMKLKEILNMEDYLKNECYCPGEIYSTDGFFFQIFKGDFECKKIGEINKYDNFFSKIPCIIVVSQSLSKSNQILFIMYEKDKIIDIVRFDATDNNLLLVKDVLENNKTDKKYDEYPQTKTQESLEKLFSICDAIML